MTYDVVALASMTRPGRRRHVSPALVMSALVHAGIWLLANDLRAPLQQVVIPQSQIEFSLAQPRPEPPEPPPLMAASAPSQPPPPHTKSSRAPARARSVEPPKPTVTATSPASAEPADVPVPTVPEPAAPSDLALPNQPVDFTTTPVVVGTTGPGAIASANERGIARPAPSEPSSVAGTGQGESSGVALEQANWSCPWPSGADAERIDEQTVVIRVVVGVTGAVESAVLVSDPGHGFGAAALACAQRTRFTPARDADGNPVRAQSPPIRVRFTR